jgi:hypothetical protein
MIFGHVVDGAEIWKGGLYGWKDALHLLFFLELVILALGHWLE